MSRRINRTGDASSIANLIRRLRLACTIDGEPSATVTPALEVGHHPALTRSSQVWPRAARRSQSRQAQTATPVSPDVRSGGVDRGATSHPRAGTVRVGTCCHPGAVVCSDGREGPWCFPRPQAEARNRWTLLDERHTSARAPVPRRCGQQRLVHPRPRSGEVRVGTQLRNFSVLRSATFLAAGERQLERRPCEATLNGPQVPPTHREGSSAEPLPKAAAATATATASPPTLSGGYSGNRSYGHGRYPRGDCMRARLPWGASR